MRAAAIFVSASLAAAWLHAQELPRREAQSPSDAALFIAPSLLLDSAGAPASATDGEVARAAIARDRARQKSERWARLQKSGVLSKAESERAALQASEAGAKFERAHAAQLARQLAELQARGASPELIASAAAALHTAESLASEAASAFKKMQSAVAELDLARHRALVSSGLVSRDALRRAEVELAKLKEAAK